MSENVDNEKLVEVFNGSRWEAELVKGLLESAGIDANVKDGLMSSIVPYVSPTVSVQVNSDQYEPAMEIIRSRDNNQ